MRAEDERAVGAEVAVAPRVVAGDDASKGELMEVAESVPGTVKPP